MEYTLGVALTRNVHYLRVFVPLTPATIYHYDTSNLRASAIDLPYNTNKHLFVQHVTTSNPRSLSFASFVAGIEYEHVKAIWALHDKQFSIDR